MCNEYMLITNIRYGILVITMFNCTCQVSSIMCEKQTSRSFTTSKVRASTPFICKP